MLAMRDQEYLNQVVVGWNRRAEWRACLRCRIASCHRAVMTELERPAELLSVALMRYLPGAGGGFDGVAGVDDPASDELESSGGEDMAGEEVAGLVTIRVVVASSGKPIMTGDVEAKSVETIVDEAVA